jgi:hypothetical protein
MKKENKIPAENNDMLPEYDFKGKKGVRGNYYLGPNQAHTVQIEYEDGTVTEQHFNSLGHPIMLDPDVFVFFPDSDSVNKALRSIIALFPKTQVSEEKAKYSHR